MSVSVATRETILSTCKKLVSEKGLSFLNMRAVAKASGVALGSIYYYFPSKNDLLVATIESVWEDIFRLNDIETGELSFVEYICLCFEHIQMGIKKYPNFFTVHSVSVSTNGKDKAKNLMDIYLSQIKKEMLNSLHEDKNVSKNVFSTDFTETKFIDFVLSNIVYLLMQKNDNCEVLLEVIHRIIYLD